MKKSFIILLSALLLTTGCTNSTGGESSSETDNDNPQTVISDAYPQFTGIPLSEQVINEYSTLNNKQGMPQIFCNNGDMIYFANPADGLMLYSYDGKETKRLTDIAAFSLNYYNNSVYFLSPEYAGKLSTWLLPMNPRSGTLYRYDIESGAVAKLGDTLMDDLRVDENGIFCSMTEEDGITYIYRVDPQSGECERAYRGFGIQHIGGYELTEEERSDNDGLDILLVNDSEKVRILTYVVPFYDCVHKGIYYYRDNNTGLSFHSLNLANGDLKDLDDCSDYTVFEDKLFLIRKSKLYLSDGNDVKKVSVEPYTLGNPSTLNVYEYNIDYLYTANGKMYAVVSHKADEYSFAQLNFSPDALSASVTVIE